MENKKEKFVSLAEAAKMLGRTPQYLNMLSRSGKLKAEKIGRNWYISQNHLDEYVNLIEGKSVEKFIEPFREETITENSKNYEPQLDAGSKNIFSLERGLNRNKKENLKSEIKKVFQDIEDEKRARKERDIAASVFSLQRKTKPRKKHFFEKPIFTKISVPALVIFSAFVFYHKLSDPIKLPIVAGEEITNAEVVVEGQAENGNSNSGYSYSNSNSDSTSKNVLSSLGFHKVRIQSGRYPIKDIKTFYESGDLIFKENKLFRIKRNAVDSTEIERHSIEADDIDTNSVTSRTIRDETIKDEDIDDNINLHVRSITAQESIEITGALTVGGLATFENGINISSGGANITGDLTLNGDLNLGANTIVITNATLISNLNADLLDGQHGSYYSPLANISGTTNYLAKFTGANSVGNSMIYDDGTNVGIGVVAPAAKLDVLGTLGTQLRLSYSDSIYADFSVASDGDLSITPNTAGATTTLGAGNDIAVKIDAGGNVGIGITAPMAKLAVYGGISAGQYSDLVSPAYGMIISGNVGIGTTSPTQKLDVAGELEIANYLYFANASSEYLHWDGSDFILTDDLLPLTNDSLNLGSDSYRWADAYLGPGTLHIGTSTSDEFAIGYDTTNNYLGFNANGSGDSELVIDSSGNVGIGTTNPRVKLDIYNASGGSGVIIDSGTGSTDTSYVDFFRGGDYDNRWEMGWDLSAIGGADGNFYFFQQSAGRVLNLTQGGNVGIGTTSPDNKLDVNGVLEVGSGTRGALIYSSSVDNFYLTTYSNTPNPNFTIGIGNGSGGVSTTWLYGSGSGNIGIGTVSPTYLLDVNGNARVTDLYTHDGGVNSYSDKNLKNVGNSFSRGLDEIAALNPVYFRYKDNSRLGITDDQLVIGVMAQDVQKLIPEAVGSQNGYLTLTQGPIFYAMINSIKELNLSRLDQDNSLNAAKNDISVWGLSLDQKYSNLSDQFGIFKTETDPLKVQVAGMETEIGSIENKLASMETQTKQIQENVEVPFETLTDSSYIASDLANISIASRNFSGDYLEPGTIKEMRINNQGADISFYSIEDGYLFFNMYIEDPASITEFAVEIGNEMDSKEIQWDKDKMVGLTSGWNQIKLPFSTGIKTGTMDWTDINYFRIYFNSSANNQIKINSMSLNATQTVTQSTYAYLEDSVENLLSQSTSQASIMNQIQLQMQEIETQNKAILDFFAVLNPETLIVKDLEGNVDLLGGNLEAEGIVAGTFTIKVIDSESKTIGNATITAGNTSIQIQTKAITTSSKVFVTADRPLEIGVNSIVPGTSFVIEIGESEAEDVKVDWLIVEEKPL